MTRDEARPGQWCTSPARCGGQARYTDDMASVAESLRARTVARVLAMPVRERIALALALGDDDAAYFARANGCDSDAARRRLAQTHRRGRIPSGCTGVGAT